jgi:plastocyanin
VRRRTAQAGIVAALLAAGPASAATSEVRVANNSFSPSSVTIVPGDAVNWTFAGPDTNHSVTSDAGQAESFDSDPTGSPFHSPGDTFSHTFNTAGSFGYFCKVHPGMRGRVIVQAPGTGGGGDTTAPTVSNLRVRGGRRGRRRTRISLTLSEAADLRLAFKRRRGRSPRALSSRGEAGVNAVRLSLRRVPPGRYRLTVRATDDAGNAAVPVRKTFRVR